MGTILYNISIFLYQTSIRFVALFNNKAKLFVKGRKNIFSKLERALADSPQPVAWFHCASLGEFEQARPLMEAYRAEYPDHKILLTFYSPSGYEIRKNYSGADHIFYLPMDTKKNANKFLNIANPQIVFFIKYEFWYHYTKALKERNIPLLSTSSIFRHNQLFFKSYAGFYKKILENFSYFFVQDQQSLALLNSINLTNAEISGDTRFDRVVAICHNKKELPAVKRFKDGQKLMVIGSCWPEDFEVLNSFINQTAIKFILAPHEMDEKFIQKIENDLLKKVIRYSELEKTENVANFDVLIIDNIGMLSNLYAYGEYAFIGGAFGQGLHNILEPATFGLPVFFGNRNYDKFKEARDLINLGSAVPVGGHDELRSQFRSFTDETTYNIASGINKDYVNNSTGATEKIINYSKNVISQQTQHTNQK